MADAQESIETLIRRAKARSRMLIAIVLGSIAVILLLVWLRVPKELKLLTGPVGSNTHADGLRYKDLIEPQGLRVTIVPTAGAVESLERLVAERGAQACFAQVGLARPFAGEPGLEGLQSLGALHLEPFWVFGRAGSALTSGFQDVAQLRGARIAAGNPGSEVRAVSDGFLAALGLTGEVVIEPYENLSAEEKLEALVGGEIDLVTGIGSPASPNIAAVLTHQSARPIEIRRVDAIVHRNEGLNGVDIPEGALDLARNVPDRDLRLFAVLTNLVVPDGLHPAVVEVMLRAAHDIHREPTLFSQRGTYPTPNGVRLSLHRAAQRYYDEGPSVFARVLPFWLATFANRFWLVAVAAVGGLVVLLQVLPGLLSLPFLLAVQQNYKRLEAIEKFAGNGGDVKECLGRLDALDKSTVNLWVPPPQRAPYFEFRQNIHDMRDRLTARLEPGD